MVYDVYNIYIYIYETVFSVGCSFSRLIIFVLLHAANEGVQAQARERGVDCGRRGAHVRRSKETPQSE